jgi:protein subunit release factor B
MRFPVSDAKQRDLEMRMIKLGVREADIDESFIHGGGPGGQKINKTSVVVLICHAASGIEVRCQESRSQALNRFIARRILVERLEARIAGVKQEKIQEFEKIRRQKRKRSKRAKEKMLTSKRQRSETKALRGKPRDD